MDLFYLQIITILIIIVGIIFYLSIQYFELAIIIGVFATKIIDFFLASDTVNEMDAESGIGSYIRVGIYIMLGLLGVIKFFQFWNCHKGKLPYHFLLFFIFILLAMVSISYSLDQFFSFVRAFTLFVQFLFLIGLYYWLDEESKVHRTYQAFYILAIVFVVFNLIVIFLYPNKIWYEPDPDRFQGFFTQPNTLGEYCSILTPILLWKISETKERNKIFFTTTILLTNIIFLFLSGSRTAILLTILIITLWFYLKKKKLWLIIWIIIISLGALFVLEFLPQNLQRKDREVTTLTGRDQFWSGSLTLLSEKPLLGYGYNVEGKIWQDRRFYDPEYFLWSGTAKSSLHSGYLSVAIGLGVPGLILFLLIIFLPLIKLKLRYMDNNLIVAISILISFYIGNFVEAAIGFNFWIFWVIATRYTLTSNKIHNF